MLLQLSAIPLMKRTVDVPWERPGVKQEFYESRVSELSRISSEWVTFAHFSPDSSKAVIGFGPTAADRFGTNRVVLFDSTTRKIKNLNVSGSAEFGWIGEKTLVTSKPGATNSEVTAFDSESVKRLWTKVIPNSASIVSSRNSEAYLFIQPFVKAPKELRLANPDSMKPTFKDMLGEIRPMTRSGIGDRIMTTAMPSSAPEGDGFISYSRKKVASATSSIGFVIAPDPRASLVRKSPKGYVSSPISFDSIPRSSLESVVFRRLNYPPTPGQGSKIKLVAFFIDQRKTCSMPLFDCRFNSVFEGERMAIISSDKGAYAVTIQRRRTLRRSPGSIEALHAVTGDFFGIKK